MTIGNRSASVAGVMCRACVLFDNYNGAETTIRRASQRRMPKLTACVLLNPRSPPRGTALPEPRL